eukprot:g36685.t1
MRAASRGVKLFHLPVEWQYSTTVLFPLKFASFEGQRETSHNQLVLLLPPVSVFSNQEHMADLGRSLSKRGYDSLSLDWPGFGAHTRQEEGTRESFDFTSEMLVEFLKYIYRWELSKLSPIDVVACGHSAVILALFMLQCPQAVRRAVLINPTWAGPLPAKYGRTSFKDWYFRFYQEWAFGYLSGNHQWKRWLKPRNLRPMMKEGYVNPDFLTNEMVEATIKMLQTDLCARYGPISYYSGQMDACKSWQQCQTLLMDLPAECRMASLCLTGKDLPPPVMSQTVQFRSCGFPHVEMIGSFMMQHEFAEETAGHIDNFLQSNQRH